MNEDRGFDLIISARGVGKVFSRGETVTALSHVDLEVRRGEFLCLLGPSGCGKSTFLYLVAGLVADSSGTIFMHGRPIRGPGRERGVVFQEDALFPWMSVADNAAFGLRLRAAGAASRLEVGAMVAELLRLVGLHGFERRRPDELSGGMRQRAAIAACLVTEPEVLLMDEPFGALDAQTRSILQRELLRIHEASGRTTLFVTHDIREAILVYDRIAVMSARPGTIKAVVENDLPRPRWRQPPERKAEFLGLEDRLQSLIEDDIRAGIDAGAPAAAERSQALDAAGWLPALSDIVKRLGRVSSVFLLIALWEGGAIVINDPLLLPRLSSVVATMGTMLSDGRLAADTAASLTRALGGFGLAMLLGVPLGVLMGWFKQWDDFWGVLVSFSNPVPKIGLVPLFLLWFGIGETSKIAVIAAGAGSGERGRSASAKRKFSTK
jgi:NitT/TauT family transport system ATP-binding protein